MLTQVSEKWVRVRDVADHLGVSASWVNKAATVGTLPVYRVGRNLRFRISEVESWLQKQESSGGRHVS